MLLPGEQLDKLTRRTIAELRHLAPVQRDVVVEQILRADPELRPVIGESLRIYGSVKVQRRVGPLIRDSVM